VQYLHPLRFSITFHVLRHMTFATSSAVSIMAAHGNSCYRWSCWHGTSDYMRQVSRKSDREKTECVAVHYCNCARGYHCTSRVAAVHHHTEKKSTWARQQHSAPESETQRVPVLFWHCFVCAVNAIPPLCLIVKIQVVALERPLKLSGRSFSTKRRDRVEKERQTYAFG